jgi:hypothetical protein
MKYNGIMLARRSFSEGGDGCLPDPSMAKASTQARNIGVLEYWMNGVLPARLSLLRRAEASVHGAKIKDKR